VRRGEAAHLAAARGPGGASAAAEAPGGGGARRPRGARRARADVPAGAAAAGEREPHAQVGVGSPAGRLVVRADAAYARGAAVASACVGGVGGLAAERRREAAQAPSSRHCRCRRVVVVQL
jgi:hypothetical protein